MRSVLLRGFGGINQLYLGETAKPILRAGEVMVKIKSTAVNRADLVQREGHYNPPAGESQILGLECAGVVSESFPGSPYKVGDRVMGLLSGGGYGEYVSIDSGLLLPIPSNMSFEDAACIPEVWLTGFQLLHDVCHMSPSSNVMIHAAASGVGTASIQLARLHQKASNTSPHIFATSRSADKLPILADLGATDLVLTRESGWSEQVKAAGGADVILDCIGSSFFEENIKSANLDANWVTYAFMGKHRIENMDMRKLFSKRLNWHFSTLRSRTLEYRCNLVKQFNPLVPHFTTGELKVIKHCALPIEKVQDAHAIVEKNENIGKVVLNFDKE